MIVMLEVSFKRLVDGLAVRPGGSGKIHIPAAGCLLHLDVLRRKKVVSLIALTVSLEESLCVCSLPWGLCLWEGQERMVSLQLPLKSPLPAAPPPWAGEGRKEFKAKCGKMKLQNTRRRERGGGIEGLCS